MAGAMYSKETLICISVEYLAYTVCLSRTNYYFCNPPKNCQMTKNKLPLVSRLQRAIVCHRQNKIGSAT